MRIFKILFSEKKLQKTRKKYHVSIAEKESVYPDFDALKDFCTLILCTHDEKVFRRCKEHLENATDEFGGIPNVLYTLSGHDMDTDDPFGNTADIEKQLVKPQSYLISSDVGAPNLEDFFWFIENGIQKARNLDFVIDKKRFSEKDCLVDWLEELAVQLQNLYIVYFDGTSEDFHFTIMNEADGEKAIHLFKKMTAHIDGYAYTAFFITNSLQR